MESSEEGLRELIYFNKLPHHHPCQARAHTSPRCLFASGSAVNTTLCVSFRLRVVLHHSQKNGNDGWRRARAGDEVTLDVEKRNPWTLSDRPATAGRSQLSQAELSSSFPPTPVTSAPPACPPPAGRSPHKPLRLGETGPRRAPRRLHLGAPRRAGASPIPRSGFLAPATKAARRARGDRPLASGRGPHGLGPLRGLTQGGREKGFGSEAATGACPRHANTGALTHPLRLPSPPEKVSCSASPRRQGVHSPPKGSSCRAEACARVRLATSPPRLPAPAPRSPRSSSPGPGGALGQRTRGWPSPRPGLVSPPPVRVPAQRCARSGRPLRGASAAGGWRLSGRRACRALSSPGRSEAAAAAAGGGFLRCCPSRFPRISAAGTPAPPPPCPASRPPAALAPASGL